MTTQQNSPTPPERERIQEITRVVLEVLNQWQEGQKKPPGRLSGFWSFLERITKNWLVLSTLVILFVCLYTGASPFHTLEDVAREQKKRQFTLKMADRHLKLGKEYLDVGLSAMARPEYEKALKLDPANVEAQLGLIKAEAIDLVQGMREGKREDVYSPEVIKKRLDLVQSEKPGDPHVQVILGNMAYYNEDYPKAAAHFDLAKKWDPKVASAYFGLGLIYDKQGQTDKALETWQEAVRLSEWNTEYRNNLAYLYTKKADYPRAIAVYEEIIRHDPNYMISYHEIAQVYLFRGELEAAGFYQQELINLLKATSEQALKAGDRNRLPWYYETKSGTVSLESLPEKKALAHYSLAVTQYLLGQTAEAGETLQGVPVLEREKQLAVQALIDDNLAKLAEKQPSWSDRLARIRQELFPPQKTR